MASPNNANVPLHVPGLVLPDEGADVAAGAMPVSVCGVSSVGDGDAEDSSGRVTASASVPMRKW